MTADHKILNEEGESQNNQKYAVVVQDLATQSIHKYPPQTKNFTRNGEEIYGALLNPDRKSRKVDSTRDNFIAQFGRKLVKIFSHGESIVAETKKLLATHLPRHVLADPRMKDTCK